MLVLGFSPASWLVAQRLPRAPANSTTIAKGPQRDKTTAVRDVPVGLPAGARIRTSQDVRPYALAALGTSGARDFMALLDSSDSLAGQILFLNSGQVRYPYVYPPLERILDRVPSGGLASNGTALGAALTVLATRTPSGLRELGGAVTNASPAAYAVLGRARSKGGCAAQLDILLLLTAQANNGPSEDTRSQRIMATEEQRANHDCPGNPTAAWLVGQSLLRAADTSEGSFMVASPADIKTLRTATEKFTALAAAYPHDTGVLTGLGDSHLRMGTYLRSSQPFTARQELRAAVAAYNQATTSGGYAYAVPGLARALVALGEPGVGARLLTSPVAGAQYPGPLLEQLTVAAESAHDFTGAVAAARRLGQAR